MGEVKGVYLGDAVYVTVESGVVKLWTSDGIRKGSNVIYLQPGVVDALLNYVDRARGRGAEQATRMVAEMSAILAWVRQAADSAHPDTDVLEFGQSFPLVRKIVDLKNEKIAAEMMLSEVEQERDALRAEIAELKQLPGEQ